MSRLLPGLDAGDAHGSQLLAVALTVVVTGLVLELVDLDLGALGVVDDLGGDLDGRQLGLVDGDVGPVDEEQRGQRQLSADQVGDLVDLEDVAHGHLVLPAALANDRVHRGTPCYQRAYGQSASLTRTGRTRERMRRGRTACPGYGPGAGKVKRIRAKSGKSPRVQPGEMRPDVASAVLRRGPQQLLVRLRVPAE